MRFLGKTKAFREAFFKMNCLPVYMEPHLKSKWLLTDNPENFEISKHKTEYGLDSISYELNAQGFRSIEFEHDEDAINILVFGESNTVGIGLPFEDIWFNQLRSELEKQGIKKPIKMFNMAMGACPLDKMAVMLHQSIDILRPDFIIIMGPSFFATSAFTSIDHKHSQDFIGFPLLADWHKTDPTLRTALRFVPGEFHKNIPIYDFNLNIAQCFFTSLQAYFFIRRMAGENLFIFFKNPRMYQIDLVSEIQKFDSDFNKYFLDFKEFVFAPGSLTDSGFARDGIHTGKENHTYIANFIFDRFKEKGIIEKWKI
jgi:hypothetical protein